MSEPVAVPAEAKINLAAGTPVVPEAGDVTIEYGHEMKTEHGSYICWCGPGPYSPSAQFQRTVTVINGPTIPLVKGARDDR